MSAETLDRIAAVDLRHLSEEQMAALRRTAVKRGIPFSKLLGDLIDRNAAKILASQAEPQTKGA